jgi:hypothetical protein
MRLLLVEGDFGAAFKLGLDEQALELGGHRSLGLAKERASANT